MTATANAAPAAFIPTRNAKGQFVKGGARAAAHSTVEARAEVQNDNRPNILFGRNRDLGVKTVKEAVKAAGLNWGVETRSLYFLDSNGNPVESPDKALVRDTDSKYFDTVSKGWMPVENSVFFDMIEEFEKISKGAVRLAHIGTVKDGEIVYGIAEIEEEFVILGKDRIKARILFTLPNRYGKSIDVRFTPTRFFCNNQLTLSLTSKFKADLNIRFSHRTKFDPEVVFETLGMTHVRMEGYKETAEYLASKKFEVNHLEGFYAEIFGRRADGELTKAARTAMECLDTQPGADAGAGTWWQAVNSVTYATNHLIGRTEENRNTSLWYGQARAKNLQAFQLGLKLAEAA